MTPRRPLRVPRGFTLVELVMVLVLVGALATFAAPSLLNLGLWRERAYADSLVAEMATMQRRALAQRRAITATLDTTGVTFADASGTLASWPCPSGTSPCIAEAGPRTVVFNSGATGRAATSTGAALALSIGSGSTQRRLQIENETGLIRALP